MRSFGRGVSDVGRAIDFVKARPRLWKFLVAPALVSLVLLVALVLGIAHLVDPLVAWTAAHLPTWLGDIVGWILRIAIIIGLGLGAILVFVSVAGMIAGPFNELLSEAVERELSGARPPPLSIAAFLRDALVGLGHALRRLALSLACIVLLFALNLVPVVGSIAALVLGFYIAARACAYDSFDAVLARRSATYADKLAYLARHRARSLGIGASVAGMLLVPGVNLVALGLGAIAATLAARELPR